MLNAFVHNFSHNLFKPLLLFFYAGFLFPTFKAKLELSRAIYQGLTIYLLLSIGWHGGEELAGLEPSMYGQATEFMLIGFCTNVLFGITASLFLCWATQLRRVDAARVAGFYASDSAGTFVTALGVTFSHNVTIGIPRCIMIATILTELAPVMAVL